MSPLEKSLSAWTREGVDELETSKSKLLLWAVSSSPRNSRLSFDGSEACNSCVGNQLNEKLSVAK